MQRRPLISFGALNSNQLLSFSYWQVLKHCPSMVVIGESTDTYLLTALTKQKNFNPNPNPRTHPSCFFPSFSESLWPWTKDYGCLIIERLSVFVFVSPCGLRGCPILKVYRALIGWGHLVDWKIEFADTRSLLLSPSQSVEYDDKNEYTEMLFSALILLCPERREGSVDDNNIHRQGRFRGQESKRQGRARPNKATDTHTYTNSGKKGKQTFLVSGDNDKPFIFFWTAHANIFTFNQFLFNQLLETRKEMMECSCWGKGTRDEQKKQREHQLVLGSVTKMRGGWKAGWGGEVSNVLQFISGAETWTWTMNVPDCCVAFLFRAAIHFASTNGFDSCPVTMQLHATKTTKKLWFLVPCTITVLFFLIRSLAFRSVFSSCH